MRNLLTTLLLMLLCCFAKAAVQEPALLPMPLSRSMFFAALCQGSQSGKGKDSGQHQWSRIPG